MSDSNEYDHDEHGDEHVDADGVRIPSGRPATRPRATPCRTAGTTTRSGASRRRCTPASASSRPSTVSEPPVARSSCSATRTWRTR